MKNRKSATPAVLKRKFKAMLKARYSIFVRTLNPEQLTALGQTAQSWGQQLTKMGESGKTIPHPPMPVLINGKRVKGGAL